MKTNLRIRKRVDGKFLGTGGSAVPQSQATLTSLLEECFEISQEIKARSNESDVLASSVLKPVYDRLWETRQQLESLLMTHRWTLRETDLYNYSQSLREIDKLRVDGKFVDSEGNKPSGQYVGAMLVRLIGELVLMDCPGRGSGAVVSLAAVLWYYIHALVEQRACQRRTHTYR
jgi:hypothetical protein